VERFDALIIGAGPAGSAAAILLARAGWSVAVVERKEFPRRKVCGEYLSATNWPLLRLLGISDAFADLAGPPVRQTAVFIRDKSVVADLPRPDSATPNWGRALAREHLDTLLADRARKLGATFYQPWRCAELSSNADGFTASLESHQSPRSQQVEARVVIAAHGSWEIGPLATERQPSASRPGDLLAFKAHFRRSNLPAGWMPLLSFPGGYGGMVHCDNGRTSLSCCIRRDQLESIMRCRERPPWRSNMITVPIRKRRVSAARRRSAAVGANISKGNASQTSGKNCELLADTLALVIRPPLNTLRTASL
jgi:flavin-dependent dehydrogenase